MDGYILMARNRKNNCNIAKHAIYPIVSATNSSRKSTQTTIQTSPLSTDNIYLNNTSNNLSKT